MIKVKNSIANKNLSIDLILFRKKLADTYFFKNFA